MPPSCRQRKTLSPAVSPPPVLRTGVLPGGIPASPPLTPVELLSSNSLTDRVAEPKTPEHLPVTDSQLPSVAPIPVDCDVQAVPKTPECVVVPAIVSRPDENGSRTITTLTGDVVVKTEDESTNVFQAPTDATLSPVKPGSLREAMKKTLKAAAEREAAGCPLVTFLTPIGRTGIPVLDCALSDVCASRYCLWVANSHLINNNCTWRTGERSYSAMLQWKDQAPNRPEGGDDDVVLGMIGTISADSLNFSPDGNWLATWNEDSLFKFKRNGYLKCPDPASKVPSAFWDAQVLGASKVIKAACPSSKEGSWSLSHCFLNKENKSFRFRSPIFQPCPAAKEEGDEDDQSTTSSADDVPESHSYETWKFGSQDVRDAFDRVIEKGFAPQVLPVYNGSNRLVHPNDVCAVLSGAIVLVYFTLERMRFSKKVQRTTEVQFYANIANIQVLKPAPPAKHVAKKRKFAHKYSADNVPGCAGDLSDESTVA